MGRINSEERLYIEQCVGNYKLVISLKEYTSSVGLKNCEIKFTKHSTKGLFYDGPHYICELNDVLESEISEEFRRCKEWIDAYVANRKRDPKFYKTKEVKLNFIQKIIRFFKKLFKIEDTKEIFSAKTMKVNPNSVEELNRNMPDEEVKEKKGVSLGKDCKYDIDGEPCTRQQRIDWLYSKINSDPETLEKIKEYVAKYQAEYDELTKDVAS